METRITVVDGADGLTPDMLRRRPTGAERYFRDRLTLAERQAAAMKFATLLQVSPTTHAEGDPDRGEPT